MGNVVTSNVTDLIDDVIDIFVTDSKTFTAYDVTKAVREHTDEEFLHGQVREYIHHAMKDFPNIYKKATNQQFGCIQYEPVNVAKLQQNKCCNQGNTVVKTADAVLTIPKSFQDAIDKHFAQRTVPLKVVTPPAKVVAKPVKAEGTLVQDSEGRLGIPKKIVDELQQGYKSPIQQVAVIRKRNDTQYSICRAPLGNTLVYEEVKRYNVDHHGSVRIPKTMLKKMGIPLGKTYKARYTHTEQIFIDVV